jgi:adenosylcobinamide-GDP ribazoletransferase
VTEPLAGLRLALTTLTIAPVRAPTVDRRTAGRAMLAAPLVGLGVGALAAAVILALRWPLQDAIVGLLPPVLAVATMVVATRALHLDGLADTIDALGAYSTREGALEVMKKGDVGPFGVVVIVLVLLAQVAAVQSALVRQHVSVALVVSAMAGRLAVTFACVADVPAARPSGLGATVAGTVRRPHALAVAGCAALFAATVGWIDENARWHGAGRALAALVAALLAAWLLRRHAVRRLGGITGDVLGALVETGTTTALLVFALIR